MSVQPGDVIKMYDHPTVTVMAFGRRVRARVRGKVKAVEDGHIHLWTEQYSPPTGSTIVVTPGIWTSLRVLPAEYLIEDRGSKRTDADRDRDRLRKARKRRVYGERGIPA